MRRLLILAALVAMAFAPPPPDPPENVYPTNWRPDEAQRVAVLGAANRYFDLFDAGDDAGAFALWIPGAPMVPFKDYAEGNQMVRREGGRLGQRLVRRITWYKDPEGAPAGLYVAMDYVGRYERAEIYCGYLILAEVGPNRFQVMRLETSFLDNPSLEGLRKQANFDELWGQLMKSCPVQPEKPRRR